MRQKIPRICHSLCTFTFTLWINFSLISFSSQNVFLCVFCFVFKFIYRNKISCICHIRNTTWTFLPKAVHNWLHGYFHKNATRPWLWLFRHLKSPAFSSLQNLWPAGNHIVWTPVSLPASYLMIWGLHFLNRSRAHECHLPIRIQWIIFLRNS